MAEYKLGAIPNKPDDRDYPASLYLTPVKVPAAMSTRAKQSPVKYQGQLGSCTAFGWAAGKEYYDAAPDLSEQWLYDAAKAIDGWAGEGTYSRTVASILLKRGIPEERFQPYEGRFPPVNGPLAGAEENAAVYKIAAYATVGIDRDSMQAAIASSGVVPIVIAVYQNFFAVGTSGMVPAPSGTLVGYHQMLACGYDEVGIEVKNSWSAGWGDGGYCRIPWPVWASIGDSAMTMVDAPDIAPPWPDWPMTGLVEADIVSNRGAMRGYPDGTFRPWDNVTKRQTMLVARRAGIPMEDIVYNTFTWDYSPADRAFVRDAIPELTWVEERWTESLTRYQLCLLVGRFLG